MTRRIAHALSWAAAAVGLAAVVKMFAMPALGAPLYGWGPAALRAAALLTSLVFAALYAARAPAPKASAAAMASASIVTLVFSASLYNVLAVPAAALAFASGLFYLASPKK
jgi:hypothetical protein